mmetsp:Transcript_70371/g.139580  ORF Transcript_70371/g.139580 Transcript_70371/m.139580 type:complete len:1060 (-) Transcript_70371:244-3423(-)
MQVPTWMPREIASRLAERQHEVEHMKTTYLLSTAFIGGYLGREDGRRPSWFDRVHLEPTSSLAVDQQEQLASVCHVIRTKVRQAVTCQPTLGCHNAGMTAWQTGLLCMRVLWRALFAIAASRGEASQHAVPVLFMSACHGLRQAAHKLLRKVWLEVQEQFTSRQNRYRNMKSRPSWSVLEHLQYQVFKCECNWMVCDPASVPAAHTGARPSANLHDFLEETLALRFTVDWMNASMQDGQDFLETSLKRNYRKSMTTGDPISQQLTLLKEEWQDSFATMWTDDAELRGISSVARRVLSSLDGPTAPHFAATYVGQMLLAAWQGAEPLLALNAEAVIARLVQAQGAMTGTIPPPQLEQVDEDNSGTAAFHIIATTYRPPSKDTRELVSAIPRGVSKAIVRVQALFRGFILRERHIGRSRAVINYCKAVRWPRLDPSTDLDDDAADARDRRKRRKQLKVADASPEDDDVGNHQEMSQPPSPTSAIQGQTILQASSTLRTGSRTELTMNRRAWPLPTADHRACADLFILYAYSMQRRRMLTGTWQTLCGAYERGMATFAELLSRNPALRPMLESIAAQLKRGSVVGFDKAFIPKGKPGADAQGGRMRTLDAELFKRRDARQRPRLDEGTALPASIDGRPSLSATSPAGRAASTLGASQLTPALGPPRTPVRQLDVSRRSRQESSLGITEEYLTNYLKEMDGDDSQFKDISSSVIPLSTGASPPRQPPNESILNQAQRRSDVASAAAVDEESALVATDNGRDQTPGPRRETRPRLDVPFCLQAITPMWLPIKAHRFAAYRAKVLQMLPQHVLQQYIDFEKQGEYSSCIKLLESASPGSLNVLNPSTLINNKPLLLETVMQLIVGYAGLCLRNSQGSVAVRLITQVLDGISLSLRDLHPGHRTVLEAYLYDTALSICYYMPADMSLSDRAGSFFQQASDRYMRLGHSNRYCKCCLRAAAVLHIQGKRSEAEYYTQQALNKLSDAPMSSLLAVCYHNLAVHTAVQQRVPDAVSHVRAYAALLKQLPKLGSSWMQHMDNTQWLVLKIQELWPQYQVQAGMREPQLAS